LLPSPSGRGVGGEGGREALTMACRDLVNPNPMIPTLYDPISFSALNLPAALINALDLECMNAKRQNAEEINPTTH
jgi:hypothetical protein